MAKVLGLGGLFFKSRDPKTLNEWYARVLGVSLEPWGGVVFLPEPAASHAGAATVFNAFPANTDYFEPSKNDFMFNLMVDDLEGVLARCALHGVKPLQVMNDEPNGRFAHIMDPDGRKIELWEPAPMAG